MSDQDADAAQQDRAAAKLARVEQQERDRAQVWIEMADRSRHVDENTARLKALRLERERSVAAAHVAEAAAKPRAKTRPRSKAAGSRA